MITPSIPLPKNKPRSGPLASVTAYVSPEIKQKLEDWADREERSLSWLLGKLIEEAVKEWEQKGQSSKGGSDER